MIQTQLTAAAIAQRRTLIVWGAVGAAALALRLLLLDGSPLDAQEARSVLPAWQAAQGLPVDQSTGLEHPLFTSLVTLVFWLFGSSDVSARLVPALAGTVASLTPVLLAPLLGPGAALVAGVLVASCPLAIELSRRADPASLTTLCVALAFVSAVRFGWDRPRWAPWLFAGALGAGMASGGATIVALVLAGLAGATASALWSEQGSPRLPWLDYEQARGPALLGAGVAVVAATGGLFDLRGLGFLFGDVWGQAGRLLLQPTLSGWQGFAFLAYTGPLAALAMVGIVLGVKARDRFIVSLAVWFGLLVSVMILAHAEQATALLLPVLPAALLAGCGTAAWQGSFSRPRLGEPGISAMSVTVVAAALAVLGIADSFGAGRPFTRFAFIVVAVLLALGWLWPRAWRAGDGRPALGILALGAYGLMAISTIGRVSFAGSPLGSEPLRLEATQPGFRDLFAELTLAASLDPTVRLVIASGPTDVARWYGRSLTQAPPGSSNAFVISASDQPGGQLVPSGGKRAPATVRTTVNPPELNLLGIGRWLISRGGLLQAQPSDVIVTRV